MKQKITTFTALFTALEQYSLITSGCMMLLQGGDEVLQVAGKKALGKYLDNTAGYLSVKVENDDWMISFMRFANGELAAEFRLWEWIPSGFGGTGLCAQLAEVVESRMRQLVGWANSAIPSWAGDVHRNQGSSPYLEVKGATLSSWDEAFPLTEKWIELIRPFTEFFDEL
ncbi:MAG: hypothetical protein LBG52_08555 [Candidatus Peribacteria bacterium]|jgi:hypothetical protein|nr:hypothetical protein [Candidatus Peribacteria bacterium]